MTSLYKTLIHVFAAIALYVIMVVGLGWFWPIGSSSDYERINHVLINLSYSFITGYLVYILTVLLPEKWRSKQISLIVNGKIDSIVQSLIVPSLRLFVPVNHFNDSFSDQELIEMYEKGNLRNLAISSLTLINPSKAKTVIDSLLDYRIRIIHHIDYIIDSYGQELSEDMLKWLESLKRHEGLDNCLAYHALILSRIQSNEYNGSTTPDENKLLAESLIKLRNDIQLHK